VRGADMCVHPVVCVGKVQFSSRFWRGILRASCLD
jgi:hypothetical protein